MATKKNFVDLQDELLVRVAGKEEENHTISWELLKKIGDNTQNLINALIDSTPYEILKLDQVKIIFVGFFKGSAVQGFRIPETPSLFAIKKEYNQLNKDFNFILNSVNDGDFQKIADKYKEPLLKNNVINAVYEFSNSVGTKPFTVVKRKVDDEYILLAKVRKMTIKQKALLTVDIKEINLNRQSELTEAVGKLLLTKDSKGKISKKILHVYNQKEAELSLSFEHIETEKRIYHLKSPITFRITSDDNKSVTVENYLLDIYAFGKTMHEAKQDLFEQFDFTYRRLTQIEDDKLSSHLLDAKKYITLIVLKVKDK